MNAHLNFPPNTLTSLSFLVYCQRLFYKSTSAGCELAFHPVGQSAMQFYAECNQGDLQLLTCEQLTFIERFSRNGGHLAPLSQVFFKVEPRVLADVASAIISTAEIMNAHGVELIVDVHERLFLANNRVNETVHTLCEHGISLCLGGYDWGRTDKRKKYLSSGVYRYVRLANPPLFMNEVDLFLDVCFEMVEKYSCRLIVDKVQSRTQHELVKKTPYHALKGFYLGRPHLLQTDEEE